MKTKVKKMRKSRQVQPMRGLASAKWVPSLLSFMVTSLLMGGCSVATRDHYELPTIALAENYANKPETVRLLKSGESVNPSAVAMGYALDSVLTEWWRVWGNDELNGLIDRALANNHDLKIATWRIAQLQARTKQAEADKSPTVSLPIGSRVEAPALGIGRTPAGQNVTQRELHQIGLRVDWRPDLWGELSSAQQSAELMLWRATYARDDVQRQLITSIANSYIEYLTLNDRLRVAKETEVELNRMLEAVRTRLQKGDATITELEQQKTAVFTVSATIPVLEQQKSLVLNQISELMGDTSTALNLSDAGVDTLKLPSVMPGVPSSLLLRRPDVKAAETRLLSADADIDLARARVLPPLDLSSQVGYGSTYLSQMFQANTLFWNAVANLSVTLFDHGKRRQEVKYAKAVYEEMVETYLKVIFTAVREVDDSLISIRQTEKQLEKKQIATSAAERAWRLSTESFGLGGVDYITLLDTERTYHKNLDELYTVKMNRFQAMVSLLGSLGGGISREGVDDKNHWQPVQVAAVDEGLMLMASQPAGVGNFVNEQAMPKKALLTDSPTAGSPVKSLEEAYEKLSKLKDSYVVELSGIYDRNTIASAGRDLMNRIPSLFKGVDLLPLQQGKVNDRDGERSSWYRLFAYQFANKETAEGFCASLRMQQQRCRVMSAQSVSELDEIADYVSNEGHRQQSELIATPPNTALPQQGMITDSPAQESVGKAMSDDAVKKADEKPVTNDLSNQVSLRSSVSTLNVDRMPVMTQPVSRRYSVQLGSFETTDSANMLMKHWQDQGYDVHAGLYQDRTGKQWHVVRMGDYADEANAQNAAISFANKEHVPTIVVRQSPREKVQ